MSIDMNIVRSQLAPTGVLRAGINLSNFLLVTGKDEVTGDPVGVSPSLAKHLANKLEVPVKLITYPGPGPLADDIENWDIGNIANETERAKTIQFSSSYCNIQATYLVPPDSKIQTITDVDRTGVRIVTKARSAYDLWLSENIKEATIIRTKNVVESFNEFRDKNYEVLSGLRPKLLDEMERLPGSRILDGSFTLIGQSVGCKKGAPEAAHFIEECVQEVVNDGTVDGWIEKFGVVGKLSSK